MEIIEKYPHRMCLDIIDHFKDIIKDKVVCDIGCGAGDLLEYIKFHKLAKEVHGIERSKRYRKERKYVIHGDATKVEIPQADVYLLWVESGFPYGSVVERLSKGSTIIYMDGDPRNHLFFKEDCKSLVKLEKMVEYNFDETKYGFVPFKHWKPSGKRLFGVYTVV